MKYTSIAHLERGNYQVDYDDNWFSCSKDFEVWCLNHEAIWAHLFEESTGRKVATFTREHGLSVRIAQEPLEQSEPATGVAEEMPKLMRLAAAESYLRDEADFIRAWVAWDDGRDIPRMRAEDRDLRIGRAEGFEAMAGAIATVVPWLAPKLEFRLLPEGDDED